MGFLVWSQNTIVTKSPSFIDSLDYFMMDLPLAAVSSSLCGIGCSVLTTIYSTAFSKNISSGSLFVILCLSDIIYTCHSSI